MRIAAQLAASRHSSQTPCTSSVCARGLKAMLARLLAEQARNALVADLDRARADVADQERHLVRFVRMMAADECVDRFELVDEAMLEQEIERAVDGRRCRAATAFAKLIEQVIRLDRLFRSGDELEHAKAQRRQPQAAQLARARRPRRRTPFASCRCWWRPWRWLVLRSLVLRCMRSPRTPGDLNSGRSSASPKKWRS